MAGVRKDRVAGCERLLRVSITVAAVCLAWSPPSAWAQVRWQSGTSALSGKSRAQIVDTFVLATAPGADRHLLVQFNQPVTPALRAELRAMGVHLLSFLGDNAFFASVDPAGVEAGALARVDSLSDAQTIQRDWKLHSDLVNDIVHAWAVVDPGRGNDESTPADPIVGAYILFHRDVNLDSEGTPLVGRYGAWIRSEMRSINGLVIELPMSMIKPLGTEDAVQWIEPPLPMMEPINGENRARTGADIVQAPPYNLDGSGVTVMVYDGGTARASHQDFQGRLSVQDETGMGNHPTHVSCTIGGAGIADATYTGMAPGVTIVSYGFQQEGGLQQGFLYTDPGDLEADYSQAASDFGAVISNNSIGTNTASNGFPCDWEGDYGATAQLIDTIVRGDGNNPLFSEPFRIVWANGNERGSGRCGTTYHTTAPPACAKNHITVGALVAEDDTMSSFSSWGPADDGRMKPDISAPGVNVTSCSSNDDTAYTTMSGTSMASPTVCGLAALLLEDFRGAS